MDSIAFCDFVVGCSKLKKKKSHEGSGLVLDASFGNPGKNSTSLWITWKIFLTHVFSLNIRVGKVARKLHFYAILRLKASSTDGGRQGAENQSVISGKLVHNQSKWTVCSQWTLSPWLNSQTNIEEKLRTSLKVSGGESFLPTQWG